MAFGIPGDELKADAVRLGTLIDQIDQAVDPAEFHRMIAAATQMFANFNALIEQIRANGLVITIQPKEKP